MADELIDVSADWAKRAYVDGAKYKTMYEASTRDPASFLGRARQARRLDQALQSRRRARCRLHRRRPHPLVRRRRAERLANCIDRHLAKRGDQTAIIWEGDDPAKIQEHHLPRTARRGLPHGQCAEGAGRQEGRPRQHLPADDPRSGLRHARLHAHRCRPFGGVRRLLARRLADRIHDCECNIVITADEGLRGGKSCR